MGVRDTGPDDFARGGAYYPRVRFDAISEAWGLFKERAGTWLLAGLIVLIGNSALFAAVNAVLGVRLNPAGGFRVAVPPAGQLVHAILAAVLNGLLLGGMFRLACLQVRGRRISVFDMASVSDVLPQLALGSAIYGAASFLAATFCFIPAFILAGVWMFTIPLIVDGHLHALDAIGASWRALKSQWLAATLFHLVASLLAGVGICCFFVGLLITMPLYCLSISVLYRDFFLTGAKGGYAKPPSPNPDF